MVAEAGVREAALACDCLRLFERGSGVLAHAKTSSSTDFGVGNNTVVMIFGPLAGTFRDDGGSCADCLPVLLGSDLLLSVLAVSLSLLDDFGYGTHGEGIKYGLGLCIEKGTFLSFAFAAADASESAVELR